MTPELTELRDVLGRALGDDRLADVEPETQLLRSGLVSSLELITLVSALEEHYDLEVPTSHATHENLATLSAIGRLVQGELGGVAPQRVERPAWGSWRRFSRRPVRALLLVALALLAVDQLWRVAVETVLWDRYLAFREQGQRLYPVSGDLGQDDFRLAAQVQEVLQDEQPEDGWVVVFGDSGTVGSFLAAEEAIPAQAERRLRELGSDAEVTNLAYYGRVLVKDMMLLELVWDRPLEAVVFTVSDDHLSRQRGETWIQDYPHVSLNHELLERFMDRLDPEARAPYEAPLTVLQTADRRHWGPLRRFGARHTGLERYRHFLRHLLLDQALPDSVGTSLKVSRLKTRQRRLQRDAAAELRWGLPPGDLDEDQLAILRGAIELLRARGVAVVLLLEPVGPAAWRPDRLRPGWQDTLERYQRLAAETDSHLLDARWLLKVDEFTDSPAHYTAGGSGRLGQALAELLEREVLSR